MSTTHTTANGMLEGLRAKTPYIGLLRSVPDKNGMGANEVAESSYIRQPVAFAAPSESVMRNTGRIDFPVALTDWGTAVAYALFDAQSGGNMLWFDAFDAAAPITIGSHFFVDISGLALSVGLT